jgi:hypothetical protein
MKRFFILMGTLFWIISLHSQSLSPRVLSTAGTSFSSSTGSLDFTLAELMTSTFTTESNMLTQGFHQPELLFVATDDHDAGISFNLFPNPTARFATIESTLETPLQIRIYDMAGKAIEASSIFTKQITIDLHSLMNGQYIMAITDAAGKHLFTYTLMKTTL